MTATTLELVLFEVAGQRYALAAEHVVELVRAVAIAPLPGAPAVVEGLIDCRGAVLPVFDLRRRFRLAPRPVSPADHLVIARAGERRVALRADRVLGLARVASDRVAETRAIVPGAEHVAGIVRLEDGLAFIHDPATFLSEAESLALDGALEGRG